MANRTAKYAVSIHGTNPQYLIEKIVRERIYDSRYWQEDCFLLTSALVLERAVDDLKYVGGTYGAKIDPTPFLCLVLKLLQIQPEKDIIYLYIDQPDFKYLRALGAFYLRLVGRPVEIYTKLEPLYNDYRKIRLMDNQRKFSVIHMDEFIDNLLREEKVFNITLPRLTKRTVLEDNRDIEPYKSELEEQNLIPNQLIEEKVERQKDEYKRDSYRSRHESSRSRRRSPSVDHRDHDRHRKHHSDDRHYSRHRDHHRDRDYDDSHRRQDGDSRRHQERRERHRERPRTSRSRSPAAPKEEDKNSARATRASGKFSQHEIDSENAIRAKVGLKPLR